MFGFDFFGGPHAMLVREAPIDPSRRKQGSRSNGLMNLDTEIGGTFPPATRCSTGRQRLTFSRRFKHDVARLVLDRVYSIADACQSLGGGRTSLPMVFHPRSWTRKSKSQSRTS